MKRILIADCKQEISSFNPLPSALRELPDPRMATVSTFSAARTRSSAARLRSSRPGPISRSCRRSARAPAAPVRSRPQAGRSCPRRFLAAIFAKLDRIDGIYVSLHGAMGADSGTRSRGLPAGEAAPARRPGHADRHLARPARHPDRPDAAQCRRFRDLLDLSPCRFRRYRPTRRRTAAEADGRRHQAGRRPRGYARSGARRRAHHQELAAMANSSRECRRLEEEGQGARRRHHDRQPLHRRA
jgi:hypothetical protein